MAFGVIGYSPEAFYSLTLLEWRRALKVNTPAPNDKLLVVLGEFAAMYANANKKPGSRRVTAADFMPWVERKVGKLSGQLLAAFKARGAKQRGNSETSEPYS